MDVPAMNTDEFPAADRVCDSCRRINIDLWIDGRELVLVENLNDLEHSCPTCPLCRWISRVFLEVLQPSDPATLQVRFSPVGVDRNTLAAIISALHLSDPPVSGYGRDAKPRANWKRVFAITYQGDPALDFDRNLRAAQTIGLHTASHESTEKARAWIQSCVAGHSAQSHIDGRVKLFRGPSAVNVYAHHGGPTHLIDCFADCPLGVIGDATVERRFVDLATTKTPNDDNCGRSCRLIDGRNSPGPYAALSYRWGTADSSSWVTTKHNIASRQVLLQKATLPKTLRDAIQITRGLHIRYLWIDAICIIQHSKTHWLEESAVMGAVFENALVTVCASSSDDSDQGIFNRRSVHPIESAAQKNPDAIIIRSVLKSGAPSRLCFQFCSYNDRQIPSRAGVTAFQTTCLSQSTLINRSWCCQEAILSRRKLYYTSEQLYWECDHLKTTEDALLKSWSSESYMSTRRSSNASKWYHSLIASDYSPRRCTVPSDRLIALSGLARKASATFRCRYLAGLWADSLSRALSWKFMYGASTEQSCEYTAPSWSWASQPRAVRFTLPFGYGMKPKYECRLLEADIQLAGQDEFGAITSGNLKLMSKVWGVRIEPCDGCGFDYEHRVFIDDVAFSAYYDNDCYSHRRSPLMAVSTFFAKPDPTDALVEVCDFVLVQKIDEPATYRRVGTSKLWVFWQREMRLPGDVKENLTMRHEFLEAMFEAQAETELTLK